MQLSVGISLCIEYLAIVERQSCLIDKEVLKVVVVETQRTAVEPYEKRRLGTYELDAWNVLLEEGFGKEDVLLYIVQHLTSPLFALAHRSSIPA